MRALFFSIFAFVPILVLGLAFLTVIGVVGHEWLDSLIDTQVIFVPSAIFFTVALAVHIVDVWRNPRVPADKRALWTVVLLTASWYALPFYFWFYVRDPRV